MSQVPTTTSPTTGAQAAIGSARSASPASSASSTSSAQPGGSLDKNAFLRLMMVQLQHQDPLDPSDPTQYLSELANFSTLEQETNIATTSSAAAQEQNATTALSLLGRTVNYTNADGTAASGVVQKVDFTSAGPSLTINGVSGIDVGSVGAVS